MTTNPLPLLRQTITQNFSLDELRVVCFDLSIDFENLRGETKASKVAALLADAQRFGRLEALLAALHAAKPHLKLAQQAAATALDTQVIR